MNNAVRDNMTKKRNLEKENSRLREKVESYEQLLEGFKDQPMVIGSVERVLNEIGRAHV